MEPALEVLRVRAPLGLSAKKEEFVMTVTTPRCGSEREEMLLWALLLHSRSLRRSSIRQG